MASDGTCVDQLEYVRQTRLDTVQFAEGPKIDRLLTGAVKGAGTFDLNKTAEEVPIEKFISPGDMGKAGSFGRIPGPH